MSDPRNISQKITGRTPAEDGFYMPAEFEPHLGTVMIWPVRPGSWTNGGAEAQQTFAEIAEIISRSETVWMLADKKDASHARSLLEEKCRLPVSGPGPEEATSGHAGKNHFPIHILEIPTDDAWARDIGPTCVVSRKGDRTGGHSQNTGGGSQNTGEVRGIDWQFNAWGGNVDGLYAEWDTDNAAAEAICRALDLACYDAQHFVMEGGAVHSDGEGTLLVTESCLLSQGRNPHLTKEQIEDVLKAYLGAEKVIWLPCGIWQDETNEHVDNMCAFTAPGEVVLAWTDNQEDPQYEMSLAALRVLEAETDAKGRRIRVYKLPVPEVPVRISQEEVDAIAAAPGEDERYAGERLAASYVNFYITNESVIVPQFGDRNDQTALKILQERFPGRAVCPVEARSVIVGGGNIHCITQQIPAPPAEKRKNELTK